MTRRHDDCILNKKRFFIKDKNHDNSTPISKLTKLVRRTWLNLCA